MMNLRSHGATLLIACYELGHQPLSLAGPVAAFRADGFSPRAVDSAVEPLPDDVISAARFIAIAVPMHTAMRLGSRIAARVRAINPDVHICFFGLYAHLNRAHILSTDLGDSVVGAEVDETLVQLATALQRGDAAESVPGVTTRSVEAAPSRPAKRRQPLVPDRSDLPALKSYAGFERDGVIVPVGYVEATRGCHHTCRHCPITPVYGGRLAVVPRPVVLADARAQIAAGARHITFGDPDFFNGPGHAIKLVQALHDEFPWLSYDVTIKVEHLLECQRLLPTLSATGCAFVLTAVESLSDRVLTKLDKGHTREQVFAALRVLDAAELTMRPSLLPFSPWETLDGYLDLLRWVVEEDLTTNVDPVQFSIRLLVPPESALLREPDAEEWLGELDAPNFTHRWNHPDPRMDELAHAVSRIVEDAARTGADAPQTFDQIWTTATTIAGDPNRRPPTPRAKRGRAPRLTENWFC